MSGNIESSAPLKPLKWYRELAAAKKRREHGAFLVEGERAVRQIVNVSPGAVLEIITADGYPHPYPDFPPRKLDERRFRSIARTQTPPGILAVARLPGDTETDRLPSNPGERILVLEDIQDPGNTGTLVRTAAAFGYAGIVLSDKCADPFAPKCVQAAAGTTLSLWLRRTPQYRKVIADLKKSGHTLVAAMLEGEEDFLPLRRQKLLLALGNEAAGISRAVEEMADYRLKIPTGNQAESLNVAIAGAICMYLSASPGAA
jgi:RNA methyltransferase, TrmH family